MQTGCWKPRLECWNEGKQREAAPIETNSAAVFIDSIFQQQMVLLTITALLHYLHLVFIRPFLTYVVVINGQTCFILLVTTAGQQKWAMPSCNDGLETFLLPFLFSSMEDWMDYIAEECCGSEFARRLPGHLIIHLLQ